MAAAEEGEVESADSLLSSSHAGRESERDRECEYAREKVRESLCVTEID